MTGSLCVVLNESVAGTLSRLTGGKLRFDYADAYRDQPGATPLSLSMPIQVRSHLDHVVSPWLWGLLPDSEAVLLGWARQFDVSVSPFSLLATPIGSDCAGAVRFALPDNGGIVPAPPGDVTWLTEAEVGQRIRELREDSTAWLGQPRVHLINDRL